jgi:hypothetical protein
MTVRWPLALVIAASVLTATGGGGAASSPAVGGRTANAEERGVRTTIYFLTDGATAPIGVRRTIARKSPYARQALEALLVGPTAAEREEGITSAIPPGTELLSLRFEVRGGEATVDLSGLPADAGTLTRVRAISQITRTLVGLSGIQQVWLRADGKPFGLWMMDGSIENVAYGYDDMLAFFHICTAKPGTEAVPGDCFSALP